MKIKHGMILAAGLGKRMMPLTKNIPKPLIKVNEITLLENAINFLTHLGCKEIVINIHYKYLLIKDFIKKPCLRQVNKKVSFNHKVTNICENGIQTKNTLSDKYTLKRNFHLLPGEQNLLMMHH